MGSVDPQSKTPSAGDLAEVQAGPDATGWTTGEARTPPRLDLAAPIHRPEHVQVEVVGPKTVAECTAVHRAAWGSEKMTEERWHTLASGPAWSDAFCVQARDAAGFLRLTERPDRTRSAVA